MKKYFAFLCSMILAFTLTACRTEFNGSRLGNDNEFVVNFNILNTTDSQELTVSSGEMIHVQIMVEGDSFSFKIQREDEEPIYEDEGGSFSDEFDVESEESGTYTVTITGKNAKGSVTFKVEPKR